MMGKTHYTVFYPSLLSNGLSGISKSKTGFSQLIIITPMRDNKVYNYKTTVGGENSGYTD